MSERKFKVGDRVKCVKDLWGKGLVGKHGIIRRVGMDMHSVEFYNWNNGHNCSEHGLHLGNSGWNCETEMLELEDNETVVIYRKDNEVFAKNTITGDIAKATCHKDDEFDFAIGAKLALERLMPTESKSSYVKQDEYEIGDIVKIRDWDDMVAEFGTGRSMFCDTLIIKSDVRYSEGQKKYCGNEYKIDNKIKREDGRIIYTLDDCFLFIFTKDHFVGKRVDDTDIKKVEEPEQPKYKLGDIVAIKDNPYNIPTGTLGEIVQSPTNKDGCYTVDFKFKYRDTHRCDVLKDPTGLWLFERSIEKVK